MKKSFQLILILTIICTVISIPMSAFAALYFEDNRPAATGENSLDSAEGIAEDATIPELLRANPMSYLLLVLMPCIVLLAALAAALLAVLFQLGDFQPWKQQLGIVLTSLGIALRVSFCLLMLLSLLYVSGVTLSAVVMVAVWVLNIFTIARVYRELKQYRPTEELQAQMEKKRRKHPKP